MRTLLILIAVTPIFLTAQVWDVEPKIYYAPQVTELEQSDFTYTSQDFLNPGRYRRIRQISNQGYVWNNNVGLSLGVGRTEDLSDRLSYRLGASLLVSRRELRDSFDLISLEVLSTFDSIPQPTTISLGGTSRCDQFTNDFPISDFGLIDYLSLSIEINASLNYTLLDGLIDLQPRFFLRTPINTAVKQEVVFAEVVSEDIDITLCEHVQVDDVNKSGNSFRNLVPGVEFFIGFNFMDDLSVRFGVSQSLQSAHVYHNFPGSNLSSLSPSRFRPHYQPLEYVIQFNYIIADRSNQEEENDSKSSHF